MQARRVGHRLAARRNARCALKQRMVCPCGVSSVALFTLPAAFAKFDALPAPKKKAAALFLVPVVAVLTALCVLPGQTLPPLAPHPFSRVWATRATAVSTPCGLSLAAGISSLVKPGCASCFSECAQTRNMALGCAALWLLAIKNALASGSSQLCEKAQGKKEKLSSGVLS